MFDFLGVGVLDGPGWGEGGTSLDTACRPRVFFAGCSGVVDFVTGVTGLLIVGRPRVFFAGVGDFGDACFADFLAGIETFVAFFAGVADLVAFLAGVGDLALLAGVADFAGRPRVGLGRTGLGVTALEVLATDDLLAALPFLATLGDGVLTDFPRLVFAGVTFVCAGVTTSCFTLLAGVSSCVWFFLLSAGLGLGAAALAPRRGLGETGLTGEACFCFLAGTTGLAGALRLVFLLLWTGEATGVLSFTRVWALPLATAGLLSFTRVWVLPLTTGLLSSAKV